MKKYVIAALVIGAVLLAAAAISGGEGAGSAGQPSLPKSLDSLYPPASPTPRYLIDMLDLGTSLSGIASDLFEDDPTNARANYERFRQKYAEVAKLVPEWQDKYPTAPVDELGRALDSGDRGVIMAAVDRVGRVCHDCHLSYMTPTQQRHHWGDFGNIGVTDPLTGEELDYAQLMLRLETSMAGVALDIEQGQRENAQKQLAGFESRFAAMKETCRACHETDRAYYVDYRVQGKIDALRQALSEPTVDGRAAGELLRGIGQESCFKCHLVHLPAAYSKHR